jgi:hypothetical protein
VGGLSYGENKMKILEWFKKEPKRIEGPYKVEGGYLVELEEKQQAAKAVWESENDLLKKLDACNLGTTHFAFNGTYAEFMAKKQRERANGCQQNQLQAMQSMRGTRNGYGQCQALGNLFSNIFG